MIQVHIEKRYRAARESAGFQLEVDFAAEPGITVLFGPSGAGKSLTLDSIAGFVRPDSGRILLDGRLLFDSGSRLALPPRDRHCGYVFQSHALFPHMTLRENLMFAAERLKSLERHRRVNEMLERFQVAAFAGRYPHELSGGQNQRGSIARALIAEPGVLLLDEPARGLDLPLRDDLHAALREIRHTLEIPILLVTHDLDEAFSLGDSMLVYEAGKILQRGKPRDLAARPIGRGIAQLLGLTNIFEAEIRALDPGRGSSRLHALDTELNAAYLPGKFLGDRVGICISPAAVRVAHKPGENHVRVDLQRTEQRSRDVRLFFSHGLSATLSRADWERAGDNEVWYLELPARDLRAIG